MVYLEKPNTEIEFADGESLPLKMRYTAGEMQGWRLNMVSIEKIINICAGRCTHFQS